MSAGTRHVEMMSRLHGWEYLIVRASHSKIGDARAASSKGFLTIPSTPIRGRETDRIVNWISYALNSALKQAFRPPPDIVYASSPHLLAGVAGWSLARRWNVPFVLEVRDLWPRVLLDMNRLDESSLAYQVLQRMESFLYSEADRLVVLAEGSRRYLLDRQVDPDRITLIPNAADPNDFLVTEDRASLRQRFGMSRFTFVYTGAHGHANGLDRLLRAAKSLDDRADVLLVGDGPTKKALRDQAEDERLANVRFLDPIPKDQIPSLLKAADAGVHVLDDVALFHYGVSPNKVFDYLAAGLPMLTNVPGEVGEFVTRSGGGIAVGSDGLADGMKEISSMTQESLAKMSLAGKRHMGEHQSRTIMTERLQGMLDALVWSPRGGSYGVVEDRHPP